MFNLQDISWCYIHTRMRSPWYVYLWFQGFGTYTVDVEGIDYTVKHCGAIDHRVVVAQDDWDRCRESVNKTLERQPDFLVKNAELAYGQHAVCEAFCRSIYEQSDFVSHSYKELADCIKEYRRLYFNVTPYTLLPLYVEQDISDEILRRLRTHAQDEELPDEEERVQRDYHIIMTAVKDGTVTEELRDLLRIAETAQNAGIKTVDEAIDIHTREFGWMKNVGYFGMYFDRTYFADRLKIWAKRDPGEKLKALDAERERRARDFFDLLERYSGDARLAGLARSINEAIYYRSFRSEHMYHMAVFLDPLFKEIARRVGLEIYTDMFWFTPSEVIAMLESRTKANPADVDERKQAFIFISNGDATDYVFYQGREAKKIAASVDFGLDISADIRGQTAYPGTARGQVIIIRGPDDFAKMKQGAILVARSTQPDYVPSMKKAAAIVTEEGGVLCHASVIARELKIPCIIGTKIATEVLTDGQEVEVDAETGIVRLGR